LGLKARYWHGKQALMRRFGDPYRADKRYKPRPGVYALLEDRGQLLLTEQDDRWDGPQLQLPGGGIDPGEGPLWAEKICHLYLAHPVRKIAEPTEPDHISLWMPAEEAAARIYSPGDRAFVAEFLAHQSAGFTR